MKNFQQFLNEAKIVARGFFDSEGTEYWVEQHGRFFTVVAKAKGGPPSEAWDDEFANTEDAIEVAKGLADGSLDESYVPLNEDYAQQAVRNQEKLRSVVERIAKTREKLAALTKASQTYKEKAAKSKDDVAKNVYAAKISTNEARRESYIAYAYYLQTMQNYHQVKAKEIEAKSKAVNTRKL